MQYSILKLGSCDVYYVLKFGDSRFSNVCSALANLKSLACIIGELWIRFLRCTFKCIIRGVTKYLYSTGKTSSWLSALGGLDFFIVLGRIIQFTGN